MKRKIFWAFGLFVALLAVLIIVPLTIDWGRFKPQVLAAVESATGRKVTIDGELSFHVLPNPRLVADRVRVAGFGPAPDALADIEKLGIGVALRPLFDGKVEATFIHLDTPQLTLVTYADGTTNWRKPDEVPQQKTKISLEDIRIRNGQLLLKDLADGGTQTVSGISARISLPDIDGPLAFDGGVTISDVPLQAKGTFHDGALEIAGAVDETLADFTFKGRVGETTQGALTARIPDSAEFQARFSDSGDKSKAPALSTPLMLIANVTKAPKGVRLENLRATLGKTALRGFLDVALSGRTKIAGQLALGNVVTQDWSSGEDKPTEFPYKLDLPKKIDADLKLSVARLVLERGALQNIATRVVLKKGALTLDRTTLALPGKATATVAGTVQSINGFARVSATASGTVPQLRTTLAAFGMTSVPPVVDVVSGSTKISLAGDALVLTGLSALVDGSRVAGDMRARLGKTRDMSVTLTADRLDADRLQARLKSAPKTKTSDGPAPTVRFNIAVANLKQGGRNLGRVAAAGVYRGPDDAVDLARFDVANVQGYRVAGKGGLTQLSKKPEMALSLNVAGQKMSGTATISGPQSRLETKAQLNYAGAAVEASGIVNAAAATPTYALATSVTARELSQVLNNMAAKPDPARRPMGALTVRMDVTGSTSAAVLKNITGTLGPVSLAGNATLALNRAKPDIQGNFVLGDVPLRAFLGPADGGAVAGRADAAERWSREALDFSGLAAMTGKIALTAKRLTLDTYVFDAPRTTLVLDGASLSMQDISAGLFGGRFAGAARLGAGELPSLTATFAITAVPLQKIEAAFMASEPATGTAKIQGNISAQGRSQYEMVQSLGGSGTLASEQGIIKKVNLRRVNDRMKTLGTVNDFIKLGVTAIQGGETPYRYLQSDWAIARGVVTVQPILSDMDGGNVSGKALIDLPRWQVASNILIKLDDFTQAPPIGMTMTGPLTAPVTKYDFLGLQKYFGVRAANAGLKAIVKGEGFNPKDLLGIRKKPAAPAPTQTPTQTPAGSETAATPAETGSAETPPAQAAAPKTPEQELKDTVLQGLGGLLKKKKPAPQPAPEPQPQPEVAPQQ
jgi:uncharacterized protein involved in outer membrane biogenesis